jgi:hypothetical protein
MKMTTYLLKNTITGALGGLLFGFDTAVIAGTTQQLTVVYHLASFTLGLRGHDGTAIFCSPVHLSGDEGYFARTVAA